MLRVLVWAAVAVAVRAQLEFSRVHFVDRIGTSWLFRGNFPTITTNGTNGTTVRYADPELFEYMALRAQSEGNATLPPQGTYNFTTISFDSVLEIGTEIVEMDWFAANPNYTLTFWPLFGELLPPADVSNETRQEALANTTQFWEIDQLPARIDDLHAEMVAANDAGKPLVVYVHCDAGCDRTGEFSGAYYMRWLGYNVTGAYALDTYCCGRAPDWWSTCAIAWYCYTESYVLSENLGNCLGNFSSAALP
jgi:hypothetical protein